MQRKTSVRMQNAHKTHTQMYRDFGEANSMQGKREREKARSAALAARANENESAT